MAMLAEPRRKQRISLNPRGKYFIEDDSNRGRAMLQKMGWNNGEGLGLTCQGISEPIRPKIQQDARGLGFDIKADPWVVHNDKFSAILSNLNAEYCETGSSNSTEEIELNVDGSVGIELERKSKSSRARIHYHKTVKNKDLSKCSTDDWSCIFGKSVKDQPLQFVAKVESEEKFNNMNDYFKEKLTERKKKKNHENSFENECADVETQEEPPKKKKKSKNKCKDATENCELEQNGESTESIVYEQSVESKVETSEEKFINMGSMDDYFKQKMAEKRNIKTEEEVAVKEELTMKEESKRKKNKSKNKEGEPSISTESTENKDESTEKIVFDKSAEIILEKSEEKFINMGSMDDYFKQKMAEKQNTRKKEEIVVQNLQEEPTEEEPKRKKKKSKTKESEPSTSTESTENEYANVTTEVEPPKKKRKSKNKQNHSVENYEVERNGEIAKKIVCDQSVEIEIEISEENFINLGSTDEYFKEKMAEKQNIKMKAEVFMEEEPKAEKRKTKKSKNKGREACISSESTQNDCAIVTLEEEPPKKKKSKRKHNESTENVEFQRNGESTENKVCEQSIEINVKKSEDKFINMGSMDDYFKQKLVEKQNRKSKLDAEKQNSKSEIVAENIKEVAMTEEEPKRKKKKSKNKERHTSTASTENESKDVTKEEGPSNKEKKSKNKDNKESESAENCENDPSGDNMENNSKADEWVQRRSRVYDKKTIKEIASKYGGANILDIPGYPINELELKF